MTLPAARSTRLTDGVKEIVRRCRLSRDEQYQKDISFLLMLVRQREWDLAILHKKYKGVK